MLRDLYHGIAEGFSVNAWRILIDETMTCQIQQCTVAEARQVLAIVKRSKPTLMRKRQPKDSLLSKSCSHRSFSATMPFDRFKEILIFIFSFDKKSIVPNICSLTSLV